MNKNILSKDSYLIVNRELILKLGIDIALLLCELCSESDYYETKNNLDNGWFYSTIANINKNIKIKTSKQRIMINKLKDIGVIDIKIMGLPAKRYFKINQNVLENLVNPSIKIENMVSKNNNQDCYNSTSLIAQNQPQIIIKANSNSTNSNKTEINIATTLYQHDKGGVETLSFLEQLENINYLDDKTKHIVLNLCNIVYNRYLDADKEKLCLLCDWVASIFTTGRGITATQLNKQLDLFDKLNEEEQIVNLKYCKTFGYMNISKDYSKEIERHKKILNHGKFTNEYGSDVNNFRMYGDEAISMNKAKVF